MSAETAKRAFAGVLALAAAVALAACSRDDALVDYRLVALATTVELRLPAEAVRGQPDLVAGIEAGLARFGRDYYAWGDGELRELNRALTASGRFEASPAMAALLEAAREAAVASDGGFDPGVGALVERFGFHAAEAVPGAPPGAAEIDTLLRASGSILDLVLDGNLVRVADGAFASRPRFLLDLGGIAKGAAVDEIVARLEALDVAPALVNLGGDLRVVGAPAGRRWQIGIKAPRGDGLLGTIALDAGEAAFTSGDYERYYEHDGERAHHILDPRTGRPVTHTQAVTVIAAGGVTADAAATALFVAGPGAWRETASRLGIRAALRVDAGGAVEMTGEMRDRFQPRAGAASDIIAAGN